LHIIHPEDPLIWTDQLAKTIYVCTDGPACERRRGRELFALLKQHTNTKAFEDEYKIKRSSCLDACKHGPAICLQKFGITYGGVTVDAAEKILEHHLRKKKPYKKVFSKCSKG